MAEAQYMPYQSDVAGQFYRGAEFGQNFMQRRQRMQWEQEDRDIQKRQRELAEPVVAAKLQAEQAFALATLDTFKQQQQLKTRFASEAPIANEEFQKAMQLPTYDQQERALAILQPKYAWMGLIPDGRGFVETLNNSRAQAFQYALTDKKISAEMSAINARNAAEQKQIRLRGEEARRTNAERPARLSADQILLQNLADARARGDREDEAYYLGKVRRQGRGTPDQQAAEYRRMAREASAAGDTQTATDLNALADNVTGQIPSVGGGLSPAMKTLLGVTDDQPTTGGDPAPGTTGAPIPPAPVRTTQEIIGEIKF